ncbi:hypothetical protein CVS40_9552 [Lucilia cuprina]|nr:hypothetical protein CVS40_9552 [Lucilia cuprina]
MKRKFSYVAINQKQYSTETNTSSICNYLQLQQQQTAIKTKQVPQFTNKLKFIQNNTNNTKKPTTLVLKAKLQIENLFNIQNKIFSEKQK